MLYTFNYDSISLLWVALQLRDGVCSRAQASPRPIFVLVPLLPEKWDEECSQCTYLLTAISLG